MAINITAPKRAHTLVSPDGKSVLQAARFFEQISSELADLPDVGAAVADTSGATVGQLETNVNLLLASLRAAGVIAT